MFYNIHSSWIDVPIRFQMWESFFKGNFMCKQEIWFVKNSHRISIKDLFITVAWYHTLTMATKTNG